MEPLSQQRRLTVLSSANPWWWQKAYRDEILQSYPPRPWLDQLLALLAGEGGVWLMGPRGAGKSVLVHQAIQKLLSQGLPPGNICYVPADHPTLSLVAPKPLLAYWRAQTGQISSDQVPRFLFVDEPLDHLPQWHETALAGEAGLVVVGIVSDSAAPHKNGTGPKRLFLPPITFPEYAALAPKQPISTVWENGVVTVDEALIANMNHHFERYLARGGFFAAGRTVGSEVLADVLPATTHRETHGISRREELTTLLISLADHAGEAISPEGLNKTTGISKNTLRKYLNYLQDVHLVRVVNRVSKWAARLQRARDFQAYLAHPSLNQMLLGGHQGEDQRRLRRAITALLAQLPPSRGLCQHAWSEHCLGLIHKTPDRRLGWAMEVAWRDEYLDPSELAGFCRRHHLNAAILTTYSRFEQVKCKDVAINMIPLALQCYVLGYRLGWRQGLRLIRGN